MTGRKFVWLAGTSFPRPGVGPKLIQGQEHDSADYNAAVLATWIRMGAAEWIEPAREAAPERHERKAAKSGGR